MLTAPKSAACPVWDSPWPNRYPARLLGAGDMATTAPPRSKKRAYAR